LSKTENIATKLIFFGVILKSADKNITFARLLESKLKYGNSCKWYSLDRKPALGELFRSIAQFYKDATG
jgi:hypothetical protein